MLKLTRDRRCLRLTILLGAAASFALLCSRLMGSAASEGNLGPASKLSSRRNGYEAQTPITDSPMIRPQHSGSPFIGFYGEIIGFAPPTAQHPGGYHAMHIELHSVAMSHRNYFLIKFGSEEVLNPNIIPHPRLNDTWIVVAQRAGEENVGIVKPSTELVCNARFIEEVLTCVDVDAGKARDDKSDGSDSAEVAVEPTPLPIEPTTGGPGNCPEEVAFFSLNVGPHDARVFRTPRGDPLIIYGSNSHVTCFGQWLQDFRALVPDFLNSSGAAAAAAAADNNNKHHQHQTLDPSAFATGTELQRPGSSPYKLIETNWFLFWDAAGAAYVHTDLRPQRAFAPLRADGSAGPSSRKSKKRWSAGTADDDACLGQHLPDSPDLEQASNSLAVTLCRRTDPECVPTEENTFVFVMVQQRTVADDGHVGWHPYVVVFRQRAPFEVWAVSKWPIWISGRRLLPNGDTEGLRMTSINWREKGSGYHGFVDDVLFLAFGREEKEGGAMDVLAGDLLGHLALC